MSYGSMQELALADKRNPPEGAARALAEEREKHGEPNADDDDDSIREGDSRGRFM